MIIDKVKPYWTPQEEALIFDLLDEQQRIIDMLGDRDGLSITLDDKALGEWQDLDRQIKATNKAVEDRYIQSFSHNKKGIYADIEEIVNAIEQADYRARVKEQLAQLASLTTDLKSLYSDKQFYTIEHLKELATENYSNCYDYILYFLKAQFNALDYYGMDTGKAEAIIDKRVSLWYVKPTPTFFPMAHGKATDALAFMNGRNAEVNPVTKTGIINKFGVELAILKLTELQASLGISTDKLLSTAIATFTKQNDFRHIQGREPNREISIPLKEYASLLGYDVTNKSQLDNARKAVKRDLDIIHASVLTWEEPIKGKNRDFERVSLVTYTGIKNGNIKISFSPEIASYLAERNLITQYPTKLLSISGRQPNAYYIGRKLYEHYNIDNNQIRGTHDRISIAKLLEVTDLPTYEEVQATDRGHWQERIKEPLERALDTLTEKEILKDWKYTHARGVDLTEEEASNITRHSDFEKLYLHFVPADTVDHTERIEAKLEERQKKKKASKKK